MPFARPQHLVSTEWLAEHLDDPEVRVFETTVFLRPRQEGPGYRVEAGRAEYESGHIPARAFWTCSRTFRTTISASGS